jgi:hypothetical protein
VRELSILGEGEGEVHGRRGLAFARHRARDDGHLPGDLAVGGSLVETAPELPEPLGDRRAREALDHQGGIVVERSGKRDTREAASAPPVCPMS